MKKCPHCGAEIGEDAKFCLYCMTPLEEKKAISGIPIRRNLKWIPWAAVLCLLIVVAAVFLIKQRSDKNRVSGAEQIRKSESSASVSDVNGQTLSGEVSADADTAEQGTVTENSPTGTPSKQNTASDNSEKSSTPATPEKDTGSKTAVTSSGGKTSGVSGTSSQLSTPDTGSSQSTASSTQSTPSKTSSTETSKTESQPQTAEPTETVTYLYRNAVPADDYAVNSSVTENAVIITGVSGVSKTGEYVVPSTLGGKKVVAIGKNAFCSEQVKNTVRKVVLPETVKTIQEYAFYNCYNLTDLYLKGNAVGNTGVFLPEKSKRNYTITIHCSAQCNDRNFRTYKTLCEFYGWAKFEEWNG